MSIPSTRVVHIKVELKSFIMEVFKGGLVCATFSIVLVLSIFVVVEYDQTLELVDSMDKFVFTKASITTTAAAFSRKLLSSPDEEDGNVNQIGDACSKGDIVVFQGPTTPLPNGIPTYTVQVMNVCVSGRSISNIHLNCGWFSSARLINPSRFRRICYDDCLVNDGGALAPGDTISFQYANSFPYPMLVSSVSC